MRVLKVILPICLLIAVMISCDTDKNIENPDKNFFMKLYGEDGDQKGVDFEVLSDGTILLLGNSVSDDGIKRVYLVKVNALGQILWQKRLGSTTEEAVDIEPTLNGNFVILSSFEADISGLNKDIKIILINSDGTKLDSAMHGTSNNDFPKSITAVSDGGFIVTGGSELVLNGPPNIFNFRCDSNLDWLSTWEVGDRGADNDYDIGTKVFQVASDKFYLFATSDRIHADKNSAFFNLLYYSLDANGTNGPDAYTGPYDIDTKLAFVCQTPKELGGNFAILGTRSVNGTPIGLQLSTLRSPLTFDSGVDEQFDIVLSIPSKSLTATSITYSSTSPSGYLLLAKEARTEASNIWMTKIDQSAAIQWSVSLGSEKEIDEGAAVKELPDGKILVLGTIGVGDNQSKMALFKLNSSGRMQE